MKNIALQYMTDEMLAAASRKDLITLIKGEQELRRQCLELIDTQTSEAAVLREQLFEVEGQLITVKRRLFGKSSEKSPKDNIDGESYSPDELSTNCDEVDSPSKSPIVPMDSDNSSSTGSEEPSEQDPRPKPRPRPKPKLPSERYPNAEIVESHVDFQRPPSCRHCSTAMEATGLSEASEALTVIPRRFRIIRQHRVKYRCKCCQGPLVTAPAPPRIKTGSSYSDDMIIDVSMAKYCDLIPVERYAEMAKRTGFEGLPPNSLIGLTHYLAAFVQPVIDRIKEEVLQSDVLMADETPHRMLEGDTKSRWYLWGFSSEKAVFFECHDTRSGDVASAVLAQSSCTVLVSDVYSGYGKALRIANETRAEEQRPQIIAAYCNAHARRKFVEAKEQYLEHAKPFVESYDLIYKIEAEASDPSLAGTIKVRQATKKIFEEMRARAEGMRGRFSSKGMMAKACNYFLNNYEGLTRHLELPDCPIDNNAQERHLRNPVVGRKTWYGNHSPKAAETTATLFSLVESCKLHKVNPRVYLNDIAPILHRGGSPPTPFEYSHQSE